MGHESFQQIAPSEPEVRQLRKKAAKAVIRRSFTVYLSAALALGGCGPEKGSDVDGCASKYNLPDNYAQIISPSPAPGSDEPLTPPMGFNGYNRFGTHVTETLISEVTDTMEGNCMKELGYNYINLDDGWQAYKRDEDGNLQVDTSKFPHGIKTLSEYVHDKGFKFGIYTSVGDATCDGRPGSLGHEAQDVAKFAEWGVDYIKLDWCGNGSDYSYEGALLLAKKWREEIKRTGHPMILSISTGGGGSPWLWPKGVADLWRIGPDNTAAWEGRKGSVMDIINNSHLQESAQGAGPGGFSDLDMLEVGNEGLSATEAQSQFSLWAINASPLLLGNDVRSMSEQTKHIVMNPEVIMVDQDHKGIQGIQVRNENGLQIWIKPLSDPDKHAVVLLNTTGKKGTITVDWQTLGLVGDFKVRDILGHKDLGDYDIGISRTVPSHGTAMITLTKK